MRARVDRWKSCGVPSLRSSRALSINKEVVDALDEEKRKAFHALWDTKDTGLRAIAIVSLRCNVAVIAGLDFWEAPYWGSREPQATAGVANSVRRKTAGKMAKGSKYKVRWLKAFIDYMEVMTDTQFVFYTYSSSLTNMIKTRGIQNATVVPIE
jgi:hypothetical protein